MSDETTINDVQLNYGSLGRRVGEWDDDEHDNRDEQELIAAYMQGPGRKWLAQRKRLWLREGSKPLGAGAFVVILS